MLLKNKEGVSAMSSAVALDNKYVKSTLRKQLKTVKRNKMKSHEIIEALSSLVGSNYTVTRHNINEISVKGEKKSSNQDILDEIITNIQTMVSGDTDIHYIFRFFIFKGEVYVRARR